MTIRDFLKSILAQKRTPAEREALAAELEAIAADERRRAEADRRIGHVVRRMAEEAGPRSTPRGGRPKGSGGSYIRWAPGNGNHTGQLHIAPKLWRELGEPQRLDVQRIGSRLELRPATRALGWAVTHPTGERGGLPRLAIGVESATKLRLAKGKFVAEIRDGAIVVGDKIAS